VRRAGEVVRAAQGLAVVRSPDEDFPAVGTELVGEDLDAVGEVVDVFGPVDRPYLAVTPGDGVRPAGLIGQPVYARS
jgi:RNA-binding protein